MRRKDPGKRVETAVFDGKPIKIGDILPIPERKLKVRPKSFADDPAKGPRGVFTNGRG